MLQRALPVLTLFLCCAHCKAKPAFPPYSRPADMTGVCPLLFWGLFNVIAFVVFHVSRTASGKIRKTELVLCVGRGIAILAEAVA
ncbi:MAG: hypothetical protein ACXVB0_17250 [Mucilaginibacter sp.]